MTLSSVRRGPANPADIVLGGYVLSVPTPRKHWQDDDFVPDTFLTISRCLLKGLPHPEFWDWYTDRSAAEADRTRSAPSASLLAVGLVNSDVQLFKDDHSPSSGALPGPDRDTEFPTSLDLLCTGRPLPRDAELIGFDVVGVDYGISLFHSWLCHSYEAEVWKDLRIRLDPTGLLVSYEDAARVLAWIESRPTEQAPEPVPWTVVAIATCGTSRPDGRTTQAGRHN